MKKTIASGVEVRELLVRWVLVGLLKRLRDENRPMSLREQRTYNLGIRALARYNGLTVAEVLTQLQVQIATGLTRIQPAGLQRSW